MTGEHPNHSGADANLWLAANLMCRPAGHAFEEVQPRVVQSLGRSVLRSHHCEPVYRHGGLGMLRIEISMCGAESS
jgi:hypothetical protein